MKNTILTSIFALFGLGAMLYAQNPCGHGTIIINGQDIDAVMIDGSNQHGFSLPMWIEAGTTLAAGDRVFSISVIEFNIDPQSGGSGNTLSFNRVLTVGSVVQTVPSGKTWKIEALSKYANPFIAGLSTNSNSPICFGDNLNLTSSVSGATYAWTGPGGFTSSNQNPTINNADFTNIGTYYLTATHNGCSYTDSVNVAINPQPASTFSNTYAIENYASTFTPTVAGQNYAWTFTSGSPATSNVQNPQVTWTTAGSYQVDLTVTDGNGCSSSSQQSIVISTCITNQSQSDFSWSTAFENYPVTFTPNLSGETYSWTFDNGTPLTSTAENPQITWSNPGTYNVTLTVSTSTGCYTTTQTITIDACQTNQPQSDFSWTPASAGYAVTFTPDEMNADSYSWTFDQGISSMINAQTPNDVVWANGGTYDVTLLTVLNGIGCYTTTQNITVSNCLLGQYPESNFSWSSPGTGQNITFTPDDMGADTYTWTFNQAIPNGSTNIVPNNIVWASPGTYDVTLEADFYGVGCYITTQQVTIVNQMTFNYTGTQQTFTVPSGVTIVQIEAWGANGGAGKNNGVNTDDYKGKGGYATGTLTISGTNVLDIVVGGAGQTSPDANNPIGGWGGTSANRIMTGGIGVNSSSTRGGGSGGGGSGVFVGTSPIIIAGGGGGGGSSNTASNRRGGHGGGTVGGVGSQSTSSQGGQGGTQSAPGIGGIHSSGSGDAGVIGRGGDASTSGDPGAGGGGGGYYGGGGGVYYMTGGGGSGYIGGVTSGITVQSGQSGFVLNPDGAGNGTIIISW